MENFLIFLPYSTEPVFLVRRQPIRFVMTIKTTTAERNFMKIVETFFFRFKRRQSTIKNVSTRLVNVGVSALADHEAVLI